ncbi:MAG: TatD family hydrolase [Spirochaetaceae bacterium]|jgi:TatD DNase family protein|nr:TatD family hydrolase [Spirochaetaceae bacterium]
MIDFHCHLDLYRDPIALLSEVSRRCEFVLAVTTSPRAWVKTSKVFQDIACVATAIGFHPEILQERIAERDALIAGISQTPFIGEVGIDGSPRYANSIKMQEEVFCDVIQESERCGGRILSIHSRNAATKVLDILEKYSVKNIPVLHWFSGSSNELDRAIGLGTWFSVNPIMASANKGASLIAKIPLSKLLPETDAPFAQNKGVPYMPWDTSIVIRQFANIFNISVADVELEMKKNLKYLLETYRDE